MTRTAPASVAKGADDRAAPARSASPAPANGRLREIGAPGGFGRDVLDAGRVLLSPVTTFRRRRHRRTFLAAWLVASVASVALAWLTLSVTQRASAHLLDGVEDAELAASVDAQLRTMRWVAVGAAPLHLLARWMLIAGLFWALATFLAPELGYRGALSVAAYAGLPAVLGAGLDLGVTWFVGPEFSPELVPRMTSASSLAALVPALDGPAWMRAAAGRITVFAVWTAVLWSIGLREAAGTSWARAAGMAGGVAGVALTLGTAAELVRTSLLDGGIPGVGSG